MDEKSKKEKEKLEEDRKRERGRIYVTLIICQGQLCKHKHENLQNNKNE